MKLYLVSSGAYENWHPNGIFTTREKAEQFMAEHEPGEGPYDPLMEYDADLGWADVPGGNWRYV